MNKKHYQKKSNKIFIILIFFLVFINSFNIIFAAETSSNKPKKNSYTSLVTTRKAIKLAFTRKRQLQRVRRYYGIENEKTQIFHVNYLNINDLNETRGKIYILPQNQNLVPHNITIKGEIVLVFYHRDYINFNPHIPGFKNDEVKDEKELNDQLFFNIPHSIYYFHKINLNEPCKFQGKIHNVVLEVSARYDSVLEREKLIKNYFQSNNIKHRIVSLNPYKFDDESYFNSIPLELIDYFDYKLNNFSPDEGITTPSKSLFVYFTGNVFIPQLENETQIPFFGQQCENIYKIRFNIKKRYVKHDLGNDQPFPLDKIQEYAKLYNLTLMSTNYTTFVPSGYPWFIPQTPELRGVKINDGGKIYCERYTSQEAIYDICCSDFELVETYVHNLQTYISNPIIERIDYARFPKSIFSPGDNYFYDFSGNLYNIFYDPNAWFFTYDFRRCGHSLGGRFVNLYSSRFSFPSCFMYSYTTNCCCFFCSKPSKHTIPIYYFSMSEHDPLARWSLPN